MKVIQLAEKQLGGILTMTNQGNQDPKSKKAGNRGFASMDQEKQRQIASKGGQAAHAAGTAHEFTSEEAAAAGRKGGREVSRNREHMAEIGRKGGEARGQSSNRERLNRISYTDDVIEDDEAMIERDRMSSSH